MTSSISPCPVCGGEPYVYEGGNDVRLDCACFSSVDGWNASARERRVGRVVLVNIKVILAALWNMTVADNSKQTTGYVDSVIKQIKEAAGE